MFTINEEIKRLDIEEELNISQPMAVKLLKSLLDKEAIIRIGSGKNIVYKVKTNAL
jgi:ATP-dependent DNA helicase RecG